jgi:serine protease Do
LERTPPFVDVVRANSPAAAVGVRPDDLIVFVGENLVHSCSGFRDELEHVERGTPIKLVLMRGQELIEVELATEISAAAQPEPPVEPANSPEPAAPEEEAK